jgi:hypothetical protein
LTEQAVIVHTKASQVGEEDLRSYARFLRGKAARAFNRAIGLGTPSSRDRGQTHLKYARSLLQFDDNTPLPQPFGPTPNTTGDGGGDGQDEGEDTQYMLQWRQLQAREQFRLSREAFPANTRAWIEAANLEMDITITHDDGENNEHEEEDPLHYLATATGFGETAATTQTLEQQQQRGGVEGARSVFYEAEQCIGAFQTREERRSLAIILGAWGSFELKQQTPQGYKDAKYAYELALEADGSNAVIACSLSALMLRERDRHAGAREALLVVDHTLGLCTAQAKPGQQRSQWERLSTLSSPDEIDDDFLSALELWDRKSAASLYATRSESRIVLDPAFAVTLSRTRYFSSFNRLTACFWSRISWSVSFIRALVVISMPL